MHRVRDVMSHNIAYVTSEATVRTAVELLRAYPAAVLPVVQAGSVVGILDALHLTLYDGEVPVAEVMTPPVLLLDVDTPLAEAARRMRASGMRQVPVLREDQLVGLISDKDLLGVWGQVDDPLTGLPVQHQLRRWVMGNLGSGREIAVLFLDLDNFGLLNKRHGHVFGDAVLQQVADAIRECLDPVRDYACRYGGDEFAVGTLRPPADACVLAEVVRERIGRIPVNGSGDHVTVSIGIAGGRRYRPRPNTHPAATLDDLITQASTASTAAKELPGRVCQYQSFVETRSEGGADSSGPPSTSEFRLMLQGYRLGQNELRPEVTVLLRSGTQQHQQRSPVIDGQVGRALAHATAQCLQAFTPLPVELRVEEVYEYTTPRGLSCVGATVILTRPGDPAERLVGACAIRGDANRAYINAVLDATNRRLLCFQRQREPRTTESTVQLLTHRAPA